MLCEFAITPQSVGSANSVSFAPEVSDGIDRLMQHLNLFRAEHRVVLSDVCETALSDHLTNLASSLAGGTQDAKRLAALRKQLSNLRVWRPGDPSPSQESVCLKSAEMSPSADRIIATGAGEFGKYLTWAETSNPEVYSMLPDSSLKSPDRGDLEGQLKWLRPVLAHADFVILLSPYFYVDRLPGQPAKPRGDMPFAIAVAEMFKRLRDSEWCLRCKGQELEIRTNAAELDGKIGGITGQTSLIYEQIKHLPSIWVFCDATLNREKPYINRVLLAGTLSNGERNYRWGVELGHPAASQEIGTSTASRRHIPEPFKPMNREDVGRYADLLRGKSNTPLLRT